MPDGAGGARPTTLERIHAVDGRARFRLRQTLGREGLEELMSHLAAVAGVTKVVIRPNTGSVILAFEGKAKDLIARLAEDGRIRIADPPKPPPVSQVLELGLLRLDAGLKTRTDGALDFRTAVVLLLVFGGLLQMTRGRVAGPTTALLTTALSLLYGAKGK